MTISREMIGRVLTWAFVLLLVCHALGVPTWLIEFTVAVGVPTRGFLRRERSLLRSVR